MQTNTFNNFYRQVIVIFYAIMTGHVLFASVVVFFLQSGFANVGEQENLFLYVSIAISVLGVSSAYTLFRLKTNTINPEDAPDIKLSAWRTAFILKLALLEMPCLLNIIFYLLTNNKLYLYIYVLLAIIMLINKPARYAIADAVHMDDEVK